MSLAIATAETPMDEYADEPAKLDPLLFAVLGALASAAVQMQTSGNREARRKGKACERAAGY